MGVSVSPWRLDWQKGVDVIRDSMQELMVGRCRLTLSNPR